MAEELKRYQIGDIGDDAVVQVGENLYNYNVSFAVQNAADAEELLRLLRKKGERPYYGPLLRRLDPVVIINRQESLAAIADFLSDPNLTTLYVLGLAAMGKSTLVRGALEYRLVGTPAVWITSEGLDADKLLADLNAGLNLDLSAVINDNTSPLSQKIAAVLGSIKVPALLVLDGFEAVLDDGGNYRSQRMSDVMEVLTTFEHKLKLLITTRRLPYGIGEGTSGSDILRLRGLSEEMSLDLLRRRANLTADEVRKLLPPEALTKLHGHPKFIELFASAIAEAPVDEVLHRLLLATDIGEFIDKQILSQLQPREIDVLRAAAVFRETFTFDALNAVCQNDQVVLALRVLIRRALLDPINDPEKAYYLHPLLRDAVPADGKQMASIHSTAAQWFLRNGIDPADLNSWDEGLYHLRRAAQLDTEQYVQHYAQFLNDNNRALSYAGWSRRLVEESAIWWELDPGTNNLSAYALLGGTLWELKDYEQAETIFEDLRLTIDDDIKTTNEADRKAVEELSIIVKARLADCLLQRGKIDEAELLILEIEPLIKTSDAQTKILFYDLKFSFARKRQDAQEMLVWGEEMLRTAEHLPLDDTTYRLDAISEAHFSLGVSYLRLGNVTEMMKHLVEQLRIKIEIGKVAGIAAALSNLGNIFQVFSEAEPTLAAQAMAMLVTADQISSEVGVTKSADDPETDPRAIQQFFSDPESIEIGRAKLAAISKKLLPYFERAFAHYRRQQESPASAQ